MLITSNMLNYFKNKVLNTADDLYDQIRAFKVIKVVKIKVPKVLKVPKVPKEHKIQKIRVPKVKVPKPEQIIKEGDEEISEIESEIGPSELIDTKSEDLGISIDDSQSVIEETVEEISETQSLQDLPKLVKKKSS